MLNWHWLSIEAFNLIMNGLGISSICTVCRFAYLRFISIWNWASQCCRDFQPIATHQLKAWHLDTNVFISTLWLVVFTISLLERRAINLCFVIMSCAARLYFVCPFGQGCDKSEQTKRRHKSASAHTHTTIEEHNVNRRKCQIELFIVLWLRSVGWILCCICAMD